MTELYIIRHAQAEGNLYHMMQGQWDGDITRKGLNQIADLAEKFRDVKVDALYTSDLYRTRVTASAITKYHDIEMQCEKRLREINLGRWEKNFFANLLHDEPELTGLFLSNSPDWAVEGGETFADVRERMYGIVTEIARRHDGKSVVLVTHGAAIRCLLSAMLNLPITDPGLIIVRNTAVSRFVYENGVFTADYINDVSHLSEANNIQWVKHGEIRHEYFNPASDAAYYSQCYRGSWIAAHGSDDGFSSRPYLAAASRHYSADPESLFRFYYEDKPAGLLDLDTEKGRKEGYGWISLLYIEPELRGKTFGTQAIARAYNKFSEMGYRSVRLNVAEKNENAIRFYNSCGFRTISSKHSFDGRLLTMEKILGRRIADG